MLHRQLNREEEGVRLVHLPQEENLQVNLQLKEVTQRQEDLHLRVLQEEEDLFQVTVNLVQGKDGLRLQVHLVRGKDVPLHLNPHRKSQKCQMEHLQDSNQIWQSNRI